MHNLLRWTLILRLNCSVEMRFETRIPLKLHFKMGQKKLPMPNLPIRHLKLKSMVTYRFIEYFIYFEKV